MYPRTFAETQPDRPAVVMAGSGEIVTYAELEDRSLRLANWLFDAGLRPGDVVGLLADNSARMFDVYWATQRSGLYLMPINHRLSPDELTYLLVNSCTKALFVGRRGWDAVAGLDAIQTIAHRVSIDGLMGGFQTYEDVLGAAREDLPAVQPRGADMLYSSGTTGRPKGVKPPLPDRDVAAPGDTMVSMFSTWFGFDKNTVYLSPAPLYHAAPLRTCATVHALGGTAIVMEKFDPEAALAAIERWGVTHSQWVPTMFVRMLKLPPEVRERYDLSSMQVAVHAAAPCPVDVKQQMLDWWGYKLWEYYSSTEMIGMTVIGPKEWMARPGSVGRPVLGTVHICDDDGAELSIGEIGTIYFERDRMPFIYHDEPEKTDSARHPRHPLWTTVGDIGRIDGQDYLFLTDRKAFMIISGGVNIYPQEIENALVLHPLVADVAVFGVPDAEMGEQVKAVVELANDITADEATAAELIAFARRRLAGYKVPRSVDFVTQLPRSPTGKLMKQGLRDTYWASPA